MFCTAAIQWSLHHYQDSRVVPKAQYLDSNDSTGSYFTLNPDKASKFWMPDVFIDQAKALRTPTYYPRPASLRDQKYSDIISELITDNIFHPEIIPI